MPSRRESFVDVFGIILPGYLGKLALPLFTGETRRRLLPFSGQFGHTVGVVVDDIMAGPAFESDVKLLAATLSRDSITIERHRHRFSRGVPGVSQCCLVDISEDRITFTDSNAAAGVVIPVGAGDSLAAVRQGWTAGLLEELGDAPRPPRGYDVLNPHEHSKAAELMQRGLGGPHIFTRALADALHSMAGPAPSTP